LEFQTGSPIGISKITGKVLIVDDDQLTLKVQSKCLSGQFDIETATSGVQALQICIASLPDLVLLDDKMPEMDGYELCREIRKFSDVPIIFVTATVSLEDHLKAYDAGGDDIILKPFAKKIILQKVSLAIFRKKEQLKLINEKQILRKEVSSILSHAGEIGILQKFTQICLSCRSIDDLCNHLVDAISKFELDSSVLIRGEAGFKVLTSHGEPSVIEISVLEKSNSMGRIFQFKQRLLVNHDRVSVIVTNMPLEENENSARIRDNITSLVELTETFCGHVEMRLKSISQTERMQVALQTAFNETAVVNKLRLNSQVDLRLLLQELVDNVEKTYTWLGISHSQEESIGKTMYESVDRILLVLEQNGKQYDNGFQKIMSSLKAEDFGGEIHLF
jgi:CheY-like chemotaxis protein